MAMHEKPHVAGANVLANLPELARAAIYVRMSTTPQNFSIAHQRARIEDYAEQNRMQIVRVYADEGKSGLRIVGRDGLRALLEDVKNRSADFEYVLVYDVSRWGRFQDVDESAYYEYICRSAGIKIIYCAEQFDNDGSPLAAILKAIKRSMAAEYSRELSAKVFAAQCRLTALGYKQGGSAGYALRRLSVCANGEAKAVLQFGDRKGLPTNRVILVPGPPEELAVLRMVYRWYVDRRYGDTRIAELLNERGIASESGKHWSPWLVKNLLTNEKYLGNNVFNRRSFKLKNTHLRNPPEIWIRKDSAFLPLISKHLFDRAQAERASRIRPRTKEELLDLIAAIHATHGRITCDLLIKHDRSATPKLLARHFGTITNAYLAAGIESDEKARYGRTKHVVNETRKVLVNDVLDAIRAAGQTAVAGSLGRIVRLENNATLRIAVARCRLERGGLLRWRIPTFHPDAADFILVAKLNRANTTVEAYYLFPTADFNSSFISIRDEDTAALDAYRYDGVRSIFGLQ